MVDKIQQIIDRFEYVSASLNDPMIINDVRLYRDISREFKHMSELCTIGKEYLKIINYLSKKKRPTQCRSFNPDFTSIIEQRLKEAL